MKFISVFVLSLIAASPIGHHRRIVEHRNCINPVIGDESFIAKFGRTPDEMTDEDLRIQTHLVYVENLLRKKDVSLLSAEMQAKRKHILDLLDDYIRNGIFPRNFDFRENRVPCFIDKDGRICAVGYLVEKTAGRKIAEDINRRHQYETIYEMNDDAVDAWIAASGLTKEECAMIQPQYGYSEGDVALSYGQSYRGEKKFYSTFIINYEIISHRSAVGQYIPQGVIFDGIGLRYDYFRKSDFETGLMMFAEFRFRRQRKERLLIPVIGISPEYFQYDATSGMNFKPQVGIAIGRKIFSFHLEYGYDIPVIARDKFGAGRNDLTARVAVSIRSIPFVDNKSNKKKSSKVVF